MIIDNAPKTDVGKKVGLYIVKERPLDLEISSFNKRASERKGNIVAKYTVFDDFYNALIEGDIDIGYCNRLNDLNMDMEQYSCFVKNLERVDKTIIIMSVNQDVREISAYILQNIISTLPRMGITRIDEI